MLNATEWLLVDAAQPHGVPRGLQHAAHLHTPQTDAVPHTISGRSSRFIYRINQLGLGQSGEPEHNTSAMIGQKLKYIFIK